MNTNTDKRAVVMQILYLVAAALCISFMISGCSANEKSVIVYTSVDQVFSEPLFERFEKDTGIKVLPVYDVEAAKTTGLVNRLIAEKERPVADVFWNNEFAQTIILKEKGILQSYRSPNSSDIPAQYKDQEGYWTGFGGRARVILVNKNLLSPGQYPKSIYDLLDSRFSGDWIGIAYPVFGTAATQAAALYTELGNDGAREFYRSLKDRGVKVVDGNSVVRDLVVSGELTMGLTDTDDADSAVKKGAPVDIIFPDQGKSDIGTLIIPNTAAVIKGAPHLKEAKKFMDFLLDRENEKFLLESGWISITVRPVTGSNKFAADSNSIRNMNVNFEDVFKNMETVKKEMAEIFIR